MKRYLLICLCGLLAGIVGCGATSESDTAGQTVAQAATNTVAPTATAAATNTAEPTDTPVPPTATPRPINLPNLGEAPPIENMVWLNSDPMTLEDLRGKVVLVEFWTFG